MAPPNDAFDLSGPRGHSRASVAHSWSGLGVSLDQGDGFSALMETTSDLDGRAFPGAENGCTPTPDLTTCGGASIVRLFALRDECLAASDFPSLTISAQGVGRPLAEAAAILDGKAAQVCESAGACDRRHAFLGLSAQQCIPDLGEPCIPQVAHG